MVIKSINDIKILAIQYDGSEYDTWVFDCNNHRLIIWDMTDDENLLFTTKHSFQEALTVSDCDDLVNHLNRLLFPERDKAEEIFLINQAKKLLQKQKEKQSARSFVKEKFPKCHIDIFYQNDKITLFARKSSDKILGQGVDLNSMWENAKKNIIDNDLHIFY